MTTGCNEGMSVKKEEEIANLCSVSRLIKRGQLL